MRREAKELGLSEEQARLFDLLSIPPTEQVRGTLIERFGVAGRPLIEEALERDAIHATRPAGCWCLGVGGKETMVTRSGAHGVMTLREHCSCAEGEARQRLDDERTRQARRAAAADCAELFWDELPPRLQRFSFESYPATTGEQRKVLDQMRRWREQLANEYRDQHDGPGKPWLLLSGPYGCGKTGLAVSTAVELLREGIVTEAKVVPVPELLDRLKRTYSRGADERTGDVLDELRDIQLLVLDDLGAERDTEWAQEQLTALLNHRYDFELVTIVTTNLAPDELAGHIGERAMWRISEFSEVVSLAKCPNLRLPTGKKKPSSEGGAENVVSIKRGVA